MIERLPSLSKLIQTLQRVPYLASRNVYKVASHFLDMDPEQITHFCSTLYAALDQLEYCKDCFFWKEKDGKCIVCTAEGRKQSLVCVVESWQEIIAIEKTKGYEGVYHVLGGVISPLEGVGPEDLSIQTLLNRIQNGVEEVILATNQTPEGEATAAYIAHKLKHMPVKVTCLARGLPVGSSLDTMDRVTIYKALTERRLF